MLSKSDMIDLCIIGKLVKDNYLGVDVSLKSGEKWIKAVIVDESRTHGYIRIESERYLNKCIAGVRGKALRKTQVTRRPISSVKEFLFLNNLLAILVGE